MGRWIGVFVGDAVTDLAIALAAANIIWRTQAAWRLRLMWYFPFCLRIWYTSVQRPCLDCRAMMSKCLNTDQSPVCPSAPACAYSQLVHTT